MAKFLLLKGVLLTSLLAIGIGATAQVNTAAKRDTTKKATQTTLVQKTAVTTTTTPAKTAPAGTPPAKPAATTPTKPMSAATPAKPAPVVKKKSDDDDDETGGRNTVFAELGGPGLALSFNYDFRFSDEAGGWGMRIGAGGFAADGNTLISAPVQINYLLGNHNKFLELGAGGTFMKTTGNSEDSFFIFDRITGVVGTFTFGYRYQPANGFSFRASINPIIYNQGFIPAAGLSFGYSF